MDWLYHEWMGGERSGSPPNLKRIIMKHTKPKLSKKVLLEHEKEKGKLRQEYSKNFKVEIKDSDSLLFPPGEEKILSVTHNKSQWHSIRFTKAEAMKIVRLLIRKCY